MALFRDRALTEATELKWGKQVGLNLMWMVYTKGKFGHRGTHTEKEHIKTKVEIGVILLQASHSVDGTWLQEP